MKHGVMVNVVDISYITSQRPPVVPFEHEDDEFIYPNAGDQGKGPEVIVYSDTRIKPSPSSDASNRLFMVRLLYSLEAHRGLIVLSHPKSPKCDRTCKILKRGRGKG